MSKSKSVTCSTVIQIISPTTGEVIRTIHCNNVEILGTMVNYRDEFGNFHTLFVGGLVHISEYPIAPPAEK